MNIMVAGMLGGWEMVLVFGAVLMLFGAKKVPELMGGLGKGIKEFKKATREVTDELQSAMDDDHRPPTPPAPKALPAATVAHEEPAAASTTATPAPHA
jgi:sec-independent protein translocase protein TatA